MISVDARAVFLQRMQGRFALAVSQQLKRDGRKHHHRQQNGGNQQNKLGANHQQWGS